MNSEMAELSTVATQIDELIARVTEVAEQYHGTDDDAAAVRLFEVERSLMGAARSLRSAMRSF